MRCQLQRRFVWQTRLGEAMRRIKQQLLCNSLFDSANHLASVLREDRGAFQSSLTSLGRPWQATPPDSLTGCDGIERAGLC